jgi:hypothetical protein
MEETDAIRNELQCRLSIDDIRSLAGRMPTEVLFEAIYDSDSQVARNAAWVLTHKPKSAIAHIPQERLIDYALTTPDSSLRRLTLSLIERQGIAQEDIRTDFLDFCLGHMVMLEEPTGVQSLCMKLAHSMCSHFPELEHEFRQTIGLMHSEHYKPGLKHLIKKYNKEPNHE